MYRYQIYILVVIAALATVLGDNVILERKSLPIIHSLHIAIPLWSISILIWFILFRRIESLVNLTAVAVMAGTIVPIFIDAIYNRRPNILTIIGIGMTMIGAIISEMSQK